MCSVVDDGRKVPAVPFPPSLQCVTAGGATSCGMSDPDAAAPTRADEKVPEESHHGDDDGSSEDDGGDDAPEARSRRAGSNGGESDCEAGGAGGGGGGSAKPTVSTASASDGDEEPLLEGWTEYVDITSERPMWFNAKTKGTTWFRPTASHPPTVKGEWMQMWYVRGGGVAVLNVALRLCRVVGLGDGGGAVQRCDGCGEGCARGAFACAGPLPQREPVLVVGT